MISFSDQNERLAEDPRLEVAAVCRRIIEELVSSAASPAAFAEAGGLLNRAADILAAGAHEAHPDDPNSYFYFDRSPALGMLNPVAPPMRIIVDGLSVSAAVTYGPAHEGAPGLVHGGMLAAAFDELIGLPTGLAGFLSMTARLTVRYRSPTPLGVPLVYTASLDRINGRKLTTSGELRVVADGRLCAEAEGLVVTVGAGMFERKTDGEGS